MASVLGWVRDRWEQELEPVLRPATVEQEVEIRALWERELEWEREYVRWERENNLPRWLAQRGSGRPESTRKD